MISILNIKTYTNPYHYELISQYSKIILIIEKYLSAFFNLNHFALPNVVLLFPSVRSLKEFDMFFLFRSETEILFYDCTMYVDIR